jgi:hypothetical protein
MSAVKLKGKVGEVLARGERLLRGERVIGNQITMAAGGGKARWDYVTRGIWSGQLRVVEAKLGRMAQLRRQQPVVAGAISSFGRAVVRGRKSIHAMRSAGFTGSLSRGIPLSNLRFVEQRFPLIEQLIENPILAGFMIQGATDELSD